jgi:hypothetical protein
MNHLKSLKDIQFLNYLNQKRLREYLLPDNVARKKDNMLGRN